MTFCPFKILTTYYVAVGEPLKPALIAAIALAHQHRGEHRADPPIGQRGRGLSSSISYSIASLLLVVVFYRRPGARRLGLVLPSASDLKMLKQFATEYVR